jgi:hypothetical protein
MEIKIQKSKQSLMPVPGERVCFGRPRRLRHSVNASRHPCDCALVDCYEWIDESESERSLIMQASAARRTVEESSSPRDGALSVNDEETLHPHK